MFVVYLSKEDVYVLCADVYMHVLYVRIRVSVRQTNACFHVCAPAGFFTTKARVCMHVW